MTKNRLMRLCSMLTCPVHASSTPRKSCNYGQLFCCVWVSLARCRKVERNATSDATAKQM